MNSKIRILWLTMSVCLVASTSALRCLQCTDCEKTADTYHDCEDGYDVCMKISVAGRVAKRCAPSLACSLGGLERGAVNIWNSIKNSFSDGLGNQHASDAQLIYCCDRDYCNAAMPTGINAAFLLLLCLLTYGIQ